MWRQRMRPSTRVDGDASRRPQALYCKRAGELICRASPPDGEGPKLQGMSGQVSARGWPTRTLACVTVRAYVYVDCVRVVTGCVRAFSW